MSTFQQHQSNGFSPILLSPSSTSNPTITGPLFPCYDNSDQGSVDSDYTSLSSSKFYGHSGSTSSLHRQGRSQSIDELASTNANTTTIPTRHFNGVSNVNKTNGDPLQFVKIHPNHDLIERAQEQLTLAESRKRLQETFKLITPSSTPSKSFSGIDDDETDWSKAVENWRQKREQKRKQSVNANRADDEQTISPSNPEPSPIEKNFEFRPETIERKSSSTPPKVVPPPPPPTTTTNKVDLESTKQNNRFVSKSPSPQRIRGPSKIHEVLIEKPLEIRGFGFKLEDGSSKSRPVYISTIEDGSPADKAGLCIDDEVIAMNGENIERMTFDQVRKILKERNLRGSIKLLVRTYEDSADDNSQTVTTGPTTDHSRTPSPQKILSTNQTNSQTTTSSSSTSTIRLSNAANYVKTNDHSPIFTFSPSNISPDVENNLKSSASMPRISNSSTNENPSVSLTTPSLSIFAPKPFRSSNSQSIDTVHHSDPTTVPVEQTVSTAINLTRLDPSKSPVEDNNNRSNNPVSLNIDEPMISIKPAPLSSVESLLHGQTEIENHFSKSPVESPITQVRSSVEKQMNQLQQELLLGFPNSSNERKQEERSVPIPIDLTNAAIPKSALRKSVSHQVEPSNSRIRVQELSNFTKRTSNEPALTSSELRIQLSPALSAQSQEKVSVQSEGKFSQQRMTTKQLHTTLNQAPKRTNFEDRSWINTDSRPLTGQHQFVSQQQNGITKRAPPPVPETSFQRPTSSNQPTMFHYGEPNEPIQQQNRNHENQRVQTSKSQTKTPIRTTISSNNNRVLSVSGKLRCSRCSDELGQGSAMVIESLGLYFHIECFRCSVCNIPLSSSFEGTDVRVRENRLHCQNCFSDNHGSWRSNV